MKPLKCQTLEIMTLFLARMPLNTNKKSYVVYNINEDEELFKIASSHIY